MSRAKDWSWLLQMIAIATGDWNCSDSPSRRSSIPPGRAASTVSHCVFRECKALFRLEWTTVFRRSPVHCSERTTDDRYRKKFCIRPRPESPTGLASPNALPARDNADFTLTTMQCRSLTHAVGQGGQSQVRSSLLGKTPEAVLCPLWQSHHYRYCTHVSASS